MEYGQSAPPGARVVATQVGSMYAGVFPVSFNAFDPHEELLWAVCGSYVMSFAMPDGFLHSSFCADIKTGFAPLHVFPYAFGVIVVSHDGVQFFTKGGKLDFALSLDAELCVDQLALGRVTCASLAEGGLSAPSLLLCTTDSMDGVRADGRLSVVDMSVGRVAQSVSIGAASVVSHYQPLAGLLCLGGSDGMLRTYDVRAGRLTGSCVCGVRGSHASSLDTSAYSLVASTLTSRLGVLGEMELAADTRLRTFDLRSLRQFSEIHYEFGAAQVCWHGDGTSHLLAVSPLGQLSVLDARGDNGSGVLSRLSLASESREGSEICSLALSSTNMFAAAGDSLGFIDVCTFDESSSDLMSTKTVNSHSQPSLFADPAPDLPSLRWSDSVGLMNEYEAIEPGHVPASDWNAKWLGRPGRRQQSAEQVLSGLQLPSQQIISLGSVQAVYYPNVTNRLSNVALPSVVANGSKKETDEFQDGVDEDALREEVSAEFQHYKHIPVQLGKFGVADDSLFEKHNTSNFLCTLDGTVNDGYVNPLLLSLFCLPWVQAHLMASLSRSQFILSDELGFLFYMMRRACGSCCQPRNFHRALHQSREASALKLVDVVDVEGNILSNDGQLPELIVKFTPFLLEQLAKEAREAESVAAREADELEIARRVETARQEFEMLTGAAGGGGVGSGGGRGGGGGEGASASAAKSKESLDALVARQFAARRAAEVAERELRADLSVNTQGKNEASESVFDALFRSAWTEVTDFPRASDATPVVRETSSFVVKLEMPPSAKDRSFCKTLENCLCREVATRAWCAERKKYLTAQLRKRLTHLPNVLVLLCDKDSIGAAVMEEWESDMGPWSEEEISVTLGEGGNNKGAEKEQEAELGGKDTEQLGEEDLQGTLGAQKQNALENDRIPKVTRHKTNHGVAYRLRGVVSFSKSDLINAKEGSGHLVLAFNFPPRSAESSSSVIAAPQIGVDVAPTPADVAARWDEPGEWYLWNDFSLTSISVGEVLLAHSRWKRPCVLLYTREDIVLRMQAHTLEVPGNPLAEAAAKVPEFSLMESPPPNPRQRGGPSFTPLLPHEIPLPCGWLVAIDAEFVAVSDELTRPGKGSDVVVRPARLALARVSCVRGQGDNSGIPFIDSYIQQSEPVVNYLTRYSGIKAGDLDPSVSAHHITTMKAAYVKLRQLIDAGCCFVGHGLKKDFEIINVLVPANQVIDTVDLFWLQGSRRISLRFLAWHFLGLQMSSRLQDTHDSIEDARTALQLYRKYEELKNEGQEVLEKAIREMYAVGRENQWEVP